MGIKCLFVIFVICVICGGCGKAEGKEIIFDCSNYETISFEGISMPEGFEAFTICTDGMMLCSSANAEMYIFNKEGNEKRELPLVSFYRNICTDNNKVYAYDYEKSAIVKLTDNRNFLVEGISIIQNQISFHLIRNMVALNGKLYVLALPFKEENAEIFFAFGSQEFEDFGEQIYCIDTSNGKYEILDFAHIVAEYVSEDGRLFFYGWEEDKYYLYEYDQEKEKVVKKVSFDSMGNLLNMVVEGGYLFGVSPSEGLISIALSLHRLRQRTGLLRILLAMPVLVPTAGIVLAWHKVFKQMYYYDLMRSHIFGNF